MRSALLIGCLSLFAMLPILAIAGAGSGSRVAKEELIPAALTVEGIGTTDIELVYRKNSAYLPILAIFHFIRVKSEFSPTKGAINGFYPTPGSPFSLDLLSGKITTRDTSSTLTTEEYTFSEDEAYVREDVFRAIFHMSIRYDPRRLAVILKPDRSLPYFAAYQREEARKRALNRPERIAPDFEIYRTTSLLNGGKFVWNLSSQIAEDFRPRNSYRFDLGGEFLDGDLDANAAGLFGNRLREQNFHGTLSYPIEPPFPVREAVFGDLNSYTPSPFSIFGAELTNRPYTRRITFSQEDYAAEIPANEEVELYSGNRLVDYFQSTNDTLKHFGLPLIYGVESYDLRMYNQWGELNQSQFREVIPRQMTPPYEFDYTVSGGIIRGFNKAAGSVALSEGLTSLLTVGAGADYYQPGFTRRVLYPYANGTIRLLSSLYGDVAVSPLSASHATLELQLPNQLLADLTQQIMAEDPVLNPSGILSQTTFFFNTPIFLKETSGLAAGASAQNTIGSYYHQQTFVVSGNYYFPNFQIAYSGVYTAADNTTVQRESNPSISIRAPYSIGIQGAFTYDHGLNQFRSASLSADRFVYRDIFLQFSLDRVFNPNATFALLRLNYVLPF
ncbi:MAG TPA: hypothetical protein VKS81_04425, partial [Bacteroidota bacterium]|nr:hypothetical protein [Bacteroidota bacterium]